MNQTSIAPLDANRKPIRVGNIVRHTLIVDHAGKLHTSPARGIVVDIRQDGMIVITTVAWDAWSIRPWHACEWSVTGSEALS